MLGVIFIWSQMNYNVNLLICVEIVCIECAFPNNSIVSYEEAYLPWW